MWEAPWAALTLGLGGSACVLVLRRAISIRYLGNGQLGTVVATAAFLMLLIGSLAPWPLYVQYLELPLAAPALMAIGAPGLWSSRCIHWCLTRRRSLLLAAGLFIAGMGLTSGRSRENSGSALWELDNYNTVTAEIARLSKPGDAVLSLWPGYVFGAQRRHIPGFENHFALRVSLKVPGESRERFHLGTPRLFIKSLMKTGTSLVVLGAWPKDFANAATDGEKLELERLLRSQFEPVFEREGVQVYRAYQ